jgi:hypothetical protein
MAIFTDHKARLPKHLSYPVGLQLLATALADVPQAAKLPVSFHACEGRATLAESRRENGDYCPVLRAEFHHYRLGMSESRDMESVYEPTWSITVYGVTRARRATVRNLLIEHGIPRIVAWLKSPRSETWLTGRKRMMVSFSNACEDILVTETSDP